MIRVVDSYIRDVVCDVANCDAFYRFYSETPWTPRNDYLRRRTKKLGWKSVRGVDVCLGCFWQLELKVGYNSKVRDSQKRKET